MLNLLKSMKAVVQVIRGIICPKRSEKLRLLQTKFREDLKSDLSRYRKVVRELHHQRNTNRIINIPVACNDVHTSMSLKNAHLYNDFAHLHFLDELLGKQLDLFG